MLFLVVNGAYLNTAGLGAESHLRSFDLVAYTTGKAQCYSCARHLLAGFVGIDISVTGHIVSALDGAAWRTFVALHSASRQEDAFAVGAGNGISVCFSGPSTFFDKLFDFGFGRQTPTVAPECFGCIVLSIGDLVAYFDIFIGQSVIPFVVVDMAVLLFGKLAPADKVSGLGGGFGADVERSPFYGQAEVYRLGGCGICGQRLGWHGTIYGTYREAYIGIVISFGRAVGGIDVGAVVAAFLRDVGLFVFGGGPVEASELVVGMLRAHHIAGGGQEDAVAVDARSDHGSGYTVHSGPGEFAVIDKFAPLIACRYAPLVTPLDMCYVIVRSGDCGSQFVVLFPLIVVFTFPVAVPLVVLEGVLALRLDFAVSVEVAFFPGVGGADIVCSLFYGQAEVYHLG